MLYSGLSLEEIEWEQKNLQAQRRAYEPINTQRRIDYLAEIDKIVGNAENRRKVVPFEGEKMRAQPNQIRENRRKENERMKAEAAQQDKETVEQSVPENGDFSEDPFGYDEMFAGFAKQEDD